MKREVFLLAVALLAAGVAGRLEADPWIELAPAEFALRPELQERIVLANLDRELMARAIFHETNRVRARMRLSALKPLADLDRAADFQASIGALMHLVSHDNPMPDLATLKLRVERAGLKIKTAAENLAASTILEGGTGPRSVIVQRVAGREVFLDPDTRQEVKPRTYAGMAESLVQQWLNSPGHRANLVSQEMEYLGVSVRPRKTAGGMDSLYAVQVFFTPLAAPPLAPTRKTPRRTFSPTSENLPR